MSVYMCGGREIYKKIRTWYSIQKYMYIVMYSNLYIHIFHPTSTLSSFSCPISPLVSPFLSTVAYQGARGLEPAMIIQKNAFAPPPDLAIIIDLAPAQAVQRIQHGRGEALNAFEHEDYLGRVAGVFRQLKMPYIRRVDGSLSVQEVQRQIMAAVEEILPGRPD